MSHGSSRSLWAVAVIVRTAGYPASSPALPRVALIHDPATVGIYGELYALALGIDGVDQVDRTIAYRFRDLVEVSPLQFADDCVGAHLGVGRTIVGAQEVPESIHAALLQV